VGATEKMTDWKVGSTEEVGATEKMTD
jgi:hypothetical protein